jgi:hypothetical protein
MARHAVVVALALGVAAALAWPAEPGASVPAARDDDTPHGAQRTAASDDSLHSDACRRALDALDAREAGTPAPSGASPLHGAAPAPAERARPDARAPRAPDAQLEDARRAAAIACLANRPDPQARPRPEAPPSRLAQPPVAVRPVSVGALPAATPPTTPPGPVIPLPAPRPQYITSCDPGGCWANDGTRLQRVGPNLSAGARGLCVAHGNLLTCP